MGTLDRKYKDSVNESMSAHFIMLKTDQSPIDPHVLYIGDLHFPDVKMLLVTKSNRQTG